MPRLRCIPCADADSGAMLTNAPRAHEVQALAEKAEKVLRMRLENGSMR
jgi:hypothetical protein